MNTIKNIIFDIGNVILNFNLEDILPHFTCDDHEKNFIVDTIINSPEWLQYALIDTGYISREDAISILKDRTNHKHDELIEKFLYGYTKYSIINENVIALMKKLKDNGYQIYLLSNINKHTHDSIRSSELFSLVDGYVFSYLEHKVKPYESIYLELLSRYQLVPNECLFIDDKKENVITANSLGILGNSVLPDNFTSIEKLLEEYEINYS
jgi:putative hydrolase of the HAD superfamily